MTRAEYFAFFDECLNKMRDITKAKNHDYSGGADDPFSNFTRVEAIGVATTEQGFLTRMFDKFARITTFVNKGVLNVKDESIEDTLLDLSIYCLLFAGYIRSKKTKVKSDTYKDLAAVFQSSSVPTEGERKVGKLPELAAEYGTKVKRYWINFYSVGDPTLHMTKESADSKLLSHRSRCVEVHE